VDAATNSSPSRWELYRLLGDPFRLRLLALTSEDELAVGELAELLGESQPNVSKHVAILKRAGLVSVRKQATRAFVRAAAHSDDVVVNDAVTHGRVIISADGSLARVADVVRSRDAQAREFFAKDGGGSDPEILPPELPAYLSALAPLLPHRALAIEIGTGDGRLLDALAPVFDRVLACDRSAAQLERAARRVRAHGYDNVELIEGDLEDAAARKKLKKAGGADVVFAARVLHHAPKPERTLKALAELARPSGVIVVIDYAAHDDEKMQRSQADLWLGFSEGDLRAMVKSAGLMRPEVRAIPRPLVALGRGPDSHLAWQVLVCRRPAESDS
jgi:DNA-binding transcriptional ArsR family regulator/protein-L-isoaspartate O-methyltransferase